jgi:antitoxin component of MazEF toxin-antitoxin module
LGEIIPELINSYNVITYFMAEVFEAKLRRVGNSLGIIIPNDVIHELGFGNGDTIRVAIPSSDIAARNRKLMDFIGIERGKKPFRREKGDRF